MDEPDVDIKKELIMSKLDACIAMVEKLQLEHDLVGLVDIKTTLLMVEKEVKEY